MFFENKMNLIVEKFVEFRLVGIIIVVGPIH